MTKAQDSKQEGQDVGASSEQIQKHTLVVGVFVTIAMAIWMFSPDDAKAVGGGLTGVTTGGTTTGGTSAGAGYVITWTHTDGNCRSKGPGGTPDSGDVAWGTGGSSLNEGSYSVGISGGGLTPPGQGPGTADCEGDIVATLTWDDDGNGLPPPDAVVVELTGIALATGNPSFADCGLQYGTDDDQTYSYDSEGFQYWVQTTNTDSFDITISTEAHGTVPIEDSPLAAYAGVSLDVVAHPMRITYQGVIDADSAQPKALVGQSVKAEVNLGYYSEDEHEVEWSVTGDGQFESYSPSSASATIDKTYDKDEEYVQLAFAKVNSPAHFDCEVDFDSPYVATFTIHDRGVWIKAPDNDVLDFEKGVMDVSYYSPTGKWYFGPNGYELTVPADSGEYGNNAGKTAPVGAAFKASVRTPTIFADAENDALSHSRDGSQFCYVNTVLKINRNMVRNDNSDYPCPLNFDEEEGVRKCDISFPYKIISLHGVWPATGSQQVEGDSPYIEFSSSPYKKAEMDDKFEVFLMFRPFDTGLGSYWVPLSVYSWNPDGSASKSGSNWSVDGGDPSFSATGPTPYPDHPLWDGTITPPSWP